MPFPAGFDYIRSRFVPVVMKKPNNRQGNGSQGHFQQADTRIKTQDADGNLEVLKGTDVGYHLDVTGSVDDILKEQNDTGRKTGPGSDQSLYCDCGGDARR